MNVLADLENPIRLKVTGECNRNCFFCHKEGGMDIDTIHFSENLKHMIEKLAAELQMHSVAITGGEPLLHDDLCILMHKIMECSGIRKFSVTTNGTICRKEEFWRELHKTGLYKVNISMPDILTGKLDSLLSDDRWNMRFNNIFQNQQQLIQLLNELGVEVKINVAVINDELYTLSVLEHLMMLKDLNFEIVLLPNITSEKTFTYSQHVIGKIIRTLDLQLYAIRQRKGTSDVIYVYRNHDGKKIEIKTTKWNNSTQKLKTICEQCTVKKECQEGFYGIRVEQVNGILYVRLCIHKTTKQVRMPFEEFLKSDVFYELKKLWS